MDKNNIPVIVINREYGAGGRTLAALLSEKLSIPYYDRDFVTETVKESGMDKEEVEREGEELSAAGKMLDNIFGGTVSYSSSHDTVFKAETKVILELAKNPCIIVGRCADYVLKKAGIDVVSIYLHSSKERRMARAMELGEFGDEKCEKYIETRDRNRAIFYKKYTGNEIWDASNYTFTFDTGRIGIENCADIVVKAIS